MFNEENDFIFDTPIKWTIIEMILRRNFGKSIKLGSKRRAEKTGEGAGLVSSLFTLFLDLEKNDFDLPDRLLLKEQLNFWVTTKQSIINVSTAISGKCTVSDEECAQKAAIIHNTEHFIYKNANLWGFEETAKIPKYFGGADYENKDINAGYFLCEFIEEISFVQYHTNISVNGVAEVVKALARINGYLLSNAALLDQLKAFDASAFGAKNYMRGGFGRESCSKNLLTVADRYPTLKEDARKLSNLAKTFGDVTKMWEEAGKYCKISLLCHWDCHLGNVLWRRNGETNDYEMLKIIDWQTAHLNNPLIDLCRITLTALSPDDFQKELESLLNLYYKTLIEHSKGALKLPWENFEEMKTAFEHVFPLKVVLLGSLLGMEFFVEKIISPLPESEKPAARVSCEAKLHSYIHQAARYAEKWYSEYL